jgi:hypothetical protein
MPNGKGKKDNPTRETAKGQPDAIQTLLELAVACTWCARWPDVPVTSPRWRGGLLQAAALAREHVGCRRAGARLRVGGRAGARAVLRWPRWPGRGKMVKAAASPVGSKDSNFQEAPCFLEKTPLLKKYI